MEERRSVMDRAIFEMDIFHLIKAMKSGIIKPSLNWLKFNNKSKQFKTDSAITEAKCKTNCVGLEYIKKLSPKSVEKSICKTGFIQGRKTIHYVLRLM